MEITTKDIQKLREQTQAPILDCKKALEEAKGDFEKAKALLRKRGKKLLAKRKEKKAEEGIIGCYIHSNKKIASLVEVNCETDFVAKNEEFIELAHDLAMQVAATNPKCISPEGVSKKDIEKEIQACKTEFEGKPKEVVEKITKGRIEKFCQEISLLKQPFIKKPEITVEEYIAEKAAKLGEKIKVKRFIRMEI